MYYNTTNPNLIIEVKSSPRHDGSYAVVGYAVDCETDARIEALTPIRRRVNSKNQIPSIRNQIIASLTRRYEILCNGSDPPQRHHGRYP